MRNSFENNSSLVLELTVKDNSNIQGILAKKNYWYLKYSKQNKEEIFKFAQ